MTTYLSSPEMLRFSIAILWCVIGFGSYYFLSNNDLINRKAGILCKLLDKQGNQVLIQRLLGLFFLGAFSLLIICLLPNNSLHEYGLTFEFKSPPPWWSYSLIPVILILGYFAARKQGNLAHYPQIRSHEWTPGIIIISNMSWILFLLGYEFLFRGFLLSTSLAIMEAGPAIALNCTLYAFAHFYKGPGETFGAIPVGVLLCYLTIVTGNIWSAVILHSVMALSNEWFSLYFHPEMKIVKIR